MRLNARIAVVASLLACASTGFAAPSGQDPYVGYAYPAGGQQGTTFAVTIRGQRLRTANDAYFTGTGVHAKVTYYEGGGGPLNQLQQEELKRRLQEIRAARTGVQPKESADKKPKTTESAAGMSSKPVSLPDIPELRDLESKTPRQLQAIADRFLNTAKRPKPPIAEMLTLEVTVDPDAKPGDRELRLRTINGLSNPIVFQIGQVPESYGPSKYAEVTDAPQPLKAPVVLNGQIMPGEVDHFPLQLQAGQKLVVAVQARKLIPYLADAVPGWFQAVVSLSGPDGKEIAYADECGFDPDPVLSFQVPQDGQYTLAVRDALYRGREDFVYRVEVVDESLVGTLLPHGSRGGVSVGPAKVSREDYAKLAAEYFMSDGLSTTQSDEVEPNDAAKSARRISLPQIVNGCIASPGDKDVFRFEGRAGQQLVAEVYARRMGSPLDSLLQVLDSKGNVIASNDDHEDLEAGLQTHHADSYLAAKLPANGEYYVQVSDTQGHGGGGYCYALRVGPPQPDFALRVTPSCLNVPAGRAVTATVYAVRKDGWDGDIDVVIKDAPRGFVLSGGRIPKGKDNVRITLTVPPRGHIGQLLPIQLEGRAHIGDKTLARPAVPADDMMQAFAYHHLLPSQEFLVSVARSAGVSPVLDMAVDERLKVPAGGTAQVSYLVGPLAAAAQTHLELNDPPAGITLQDVKIDSGKITLTIKADDKHSGYADNLIVEAYTEQETQGKKGPAQKQRVSLGVLPAIPFEVLQR